MAERAVGKTHERPGHRRPRFRRGRRARQRRLPPLKLPWPQELQCKSIQHACSCKGVGAALPASKLAVLWECLAFEPRALAPSAPRRSEI
eukprot:7725390-Pyramimonas_sp.AAC.1